MQCLIVGTSYKRENTRWIFDYVPLQTILTKKLTLKLRRLNRHRHESCLRVKTLPQSALLLVSMDTGSDCRGREVHPPELTVGIST